MNIIFIVVLLLSFVALGNLIIHLFCRNRQRNLLKEIDNFDYYVKRNLKVSVSTVNWLNVYKGDLFIFDDQILLFVFNTPFGNFFKQAQPSYLFLKEVNSVSSISVSRRLVIADVVINKENIIINASKDGSFDRKFIEFNIRIDETSYSDILLRFDTFLRRF